MEGGVVYSLCSLISMRRRVPPDWQQVFLDALREGHSVSFAAKLAGVSARWAHKVRSKSSKFAEEWAAAYREGTDYLLEVVRQRALSMEKASAPLLMFLIKVRLAAMDRQEDPVEIE
jgi:hypothetical protein